MRQIVLDTETTGLFPEEGHRIIEIGCVELIDRMLTGQRFHVYLNPQRQVDSGAAEVHGLTNEFLADKPLFPDIVGDFLAFIAGAELIIHNAPFDVGFIDHELRLANAEAFNPLRDYCAITDTLALAKKKHPGQRNSLDALCKRYQVDNSHRDLHGALLDAEILAQVYLLMTGGQIALGLDEDVAVNADVSAAAGAQRRSGFGRALRVAYCNDAEAIAHEARLDALDKASGGVCLWRR
ncbi:DNA polymerase III subunit epsilon [Methylotetracoccus oryzae]|uniref:DNA polymerase III subunit epsilon n=1 Tax=Methylotetracoccus oryzae TaxID=1919059 RepID=UPI00111A6EF6|nr:DNA polymerase III subunit epsilon [Methylotetracoccus oryzae]